MKITKQGEPPEQELVGKCRWCKTEIICRREETKNVRETDTRPRSDMLYVQCPHCLRDYLWVSSKEKDTDE